MFLPIFTFRLGALLGSLLGLGIMLIATFLVPSFKPEVPANFSYLLFGTAVGIAVAAQVTTSTLIGALLPIGARKIKLDPAVIAAPAITTLVDASGMVIYFIVASRMLGV